jgi:chemotaxis protein MotB
MRNRRRLLAQDEEVAENFWPSFTDLTSTMALILFVLVLLAYIQNLISAKSLAGAQRQLKQTLSQLESSQRALRRTRADIELGQAQLKLSEERVEQQQVVIAESTRELEEVRGKLYSLAMLRLDVLRRVKESIEAELKATGSEHPTVTIADNGNIVIGERLLFEYNSHNIKKDGRLLLDTLARAFTGVLGNPETRGSIEAVLIQGHTDERGSVAYNRELAAKRANAVLNHMFEADPTLEQSYASYFASSAYSESRPVSRATTEEAHEQNRRIEISIVARDASMRSLIDQYMQNLDPAVRPQPSPP